MVKNLTAITSTRVYCAKNILQNDYLLLNHWSLTWVTPEGILLLLLYRFIYNVNDFCVFWFQAIQSTEPENKIV